MTGRTHDLAAFTTLTFIVANSPLTTVTLATLVTLFAANMIGGLAPDIDQSTSALWTKIPAGSFIGKIISPFFGVHRMISHSLLGLILFGFISQKILNYIHTFLLVDIDLVWMCFMLGYISHLVMDTITKEGVPWFFPIPIRIGIPPFRFMRFTTGKLGEKAVIFPGLLFFNVYLIFNNYSKFVDFLTHYIVK